MKRACRLACALAGAAVAVLAAPAVAADARWADPAKTLRVMFPIAETGFDPQATNDYYSSLVQVAMFESLYAFDYLARPYRFVPNTAAAMPEISTDGRVWTMRVKPGIHFADDPAFKATKRELVAADYVYAWKRLLDPKVRAPFLWYLDGKVVGADEVVARAKVTGKFDYDAPIEGLQAVDRYTIRLALKEPDFVMQGYLSQPPMAAVAREVIEAYGDPATTWAMGNPVGTGAYRLAQWRRGQKIVLDANRNYREAYFPENGEPGDRELMAAMKGKRLPQIGRVEIAIIEESNPQLLAFQGRELDYVNLPADLVPNVLDADNRLRPTYANEGIRLARAMQPSLAYCYFNMDDPVVGGYAPEKVALRRAIVMAVNVPELIRVWYQGQAVRATQPIPPPVRGHSSEFSVNVDYDPATAKALLERFGYRDRDGDGVRETPDGKPLVLAMGSATSARDRERDELWVKSMAAIGVRVEFVKQKWPDLLKMGRAGQLQMWPVGWITTYGEGDAFMQLLYSPNIGQSNFARFRNAEYDELYRQSKRVPDGAERNAIYRKMASIVAAYNPWELGVYRYENTLVRPWVQGYKKNIYIEHPWRFLDVAR
jgi:ABC-type transport system substrate-binding protein